MTRVKPGQRKRAKVAKVRTGCITCKIRRVKCDEGKPSCHRCTSTGRECDGYEQITPAASSACRNVTPDSSTSDFSLDVVLYNPSTSISKSSREQRSFQFFLERTVTQFTTFFPCDLWTEVVLQVAYCEPSIRHAVFALSAFHENFLEQHGAINRGGLLEDTGKGSFALSQYNLAIRKLVDPQSPVSAISLQAKVVNLISCLMFFSIETLRGKHYSAIQLFKYGHKIMREFHCGSQLEHEIAPLCFALSNAKTLLTDLESYFLRLGITVLQLIGDVDPIMPLLAIPGFEDRGPSIDGPFDSIREARDSFERLALGYICAFPRSQIEHISYARKFTRWSRAFLDYKESRSECARRMEQQGISLLELHMLHFETSLMMYTLPKEEWTPYAWDDNTRTFERMVKLAADAVGFDLANSEPRTSIAPKASFCLDLGVAGVMFSVTALCRDSRIRRNAIRVLRHSNMQEGVWNSQLTAHVAERIVHMEEEGLGKITTSRDVPLERRITGCCVFFDPHEKRATIRYGLEEDSPKENLVW